MRWSARMATLDYCFEDSKLNYSLTAYRELFLVLLGDTSNKNFPLPMLKNDIYKYYHIFEMLLILNGLFI